LHADGDGSRERDQHGVQHHGGDSDAAGVLRGAEQHGGGGSDHAGGAGDGAGCAGENGEGDDGEWHGGERGGPWAARAGRDRDARRDGDRSRRGGGRDLPHPAYTTLFRSLHADGDGSRERDQHGVQHHGGDGDPAGVLGAAEHHGGGGGDHAGGAGDGAGCAGEHRDGVHGEHHRGDRDQSEYRDAGRDESRRRRGGRGDVLRVEHRQGGDRLHADGNGRRERDEHGVQRHRGDRDGARVQRPADDHRGGGGDHAGGAGDGGGCA